MMQVDVVLYPSLGANITITRLFVYRLIGPAMQSGLTLFPETPAPTTDCINITGLCVANANTSTGSLPVLSLNINGSWNYDDVCMCIPGHELMLIEGTNQCQACAPSTYKSTLSNTVCTPCPLNSDSTVHGSSVCQCDSGFYRAPNDGPSMPCTGPPSAPVGILVNVTTSTYSLISWGIPASTGGRTDVYYDIYYYSTANATRVKANPQPLYATSYNFTGLLPLTTYLVTVSAENGVSNQSSSTQRSIFIAITTPEGVPMPVVGVKVLSGRQYVEWNVSSSAHGVITMYEVVFYADLSDPSRRGRYIPVPSDVTVYQVNITRDFPSSGQPVYVSVRAYTQVVGPGDWSEPIVFSQTNSLAPTQKSPSSTTSIKIIATVTLSTTSGLATTSVSSSRQIPGTTDQSTTTPTATPTESGSNPVISIVAVLGGAIGILLIVTLGAVGYFIFRKLRLKYMPKEETDHASLVKYEVVSGEEEENRVQINPLAEDS
uniref:Fibronectin type-III domain-containing protein n=1 Tax=Amphimedon queenslandica TaxID=400682 RepID=A0A1X7SZ33_AMPQE